MKILELTNYSAGICGVWQRVKQESLLLSKKSHQVVVMSSNGVKGSNEITESEETLTKVKIKRFPFKKLGGESFMSWDFESQALKFHPDIIIAHSYRHLHTTKALKLARKINAKVFLVTHAPFDRNRSFIPNTIVKLYDFFIGKRTINGFDKIIAITNWEKPYLEALGLKEGKLCYIPNGIPEEFFSQKPEKEQNKLLFLGRIAEIKNLEILIKALAEIKDKKITLEIVGPKEEQYYQQLKKLISELNLDRRIKFSEPVYDIKEKIKKIDSCRAFILPSKSEGMPQSLVEAMAREKIVIASNNPGNKDIIVDNQNGYLFENNSVDALTKKLDLALSTDSKKLKAIKQNAKNSVEKFSWKKLISQLEDLF